MTCSDPALFFDGIGFEFFHSKQVSEIDASFGFKDNNQQQLDYEHWTHTSEIGRLVFFLHENWSTSSHKR